MAVPTRQQLLVRFPELGIHPPVMLDEALAMAGRLCSEDAWGGIHADGVSYFAAHLIALRVRQVGASVGESTADPSGEGEMSTFYGQQYVALRATLPLTGFAL
jgi:hypothetical protein